MTIPLPDSGSPIDAFVNQIFHADALDLLAALPDASVDMVLADLPYGTLGHIEWDTQLDLIAMWKHIGRLIKPFCVIALTASQPFTSILVCSNLSQFRCEWIWRKPQGTGYLNANRQPMKNHESVLVFSKTAHNYYPIMGEAEPYRATSGAVGGFVRDKTVGGYLTINEGLRYPLTVINFAGETGLHPTQKPVALFEYLIRTYTQPSELVLDMTCGSGTTAVAALKSDRRYVCGDNGTDDRTGRSWADIARERVQNSDPYQDTLYKDGSKQLSLFHDTD